MEKHTQNIHFIYLCNEQITYRGRYSITHQELIPQHLPRLFKQSIFINQ